MYKLALSIDLLLITEDNTGFQLSIVKPKPKCSLWLITKGTDNAVSQSKFKKKRASQSKLEPIKTKKKRKPIKAKKNM